MPPAGLEPATVGLKDACLQGNYRGYGQFSAVSAGYGRSELPSRGQISGHFRWTLGAGGRWDAELPADPARGGELDLSVAGHLVRWPVSVFSHSSCLAASRARRQP